MSAADRRRRLAAALPDDLDGMLLTAPVSVRWASGFAGSVAGLLVPRDPDGDAVLAVDGRYLGRARDECVDLKVLLSRSYGPDLLAQAAAIGMSRVGVEHRHVTLSQWTVLTAAAGDISLVGCEAVEELRAVKHIDEMASLSRACAITDQAFEGILPSLRPGMTEREIGWQLLSAIHHLGAEGPAFDPIVAAGPNGAVPHHSAGDRPLQAGDLLTVDFGARVDGMHADMTRTVAIGRAAGWQQDLHRLVEQVQAELRHAVRPGAVPVDLDTAAAERLQSAGQLPLHGLGHGVGLEIHEEPWLIPGSRSAPLRSGTPVTVEPGAYPDDPDRGPVGGVRIEDTMVVTADGAESLTGSPRELIEV